MNGHRCIFCLKPMVIGFSVFLKHLLKPIEKGAGMQDQDPPSNLSTHFICAWETTWGRGVLLGILGGGSPNPDTISDQKMSFFQARF